MSQSIVFRLSLFAILASSVVHVEGQHPYTGLPHRDAAVHRKRRVIFNDDNGAVGREGVTTEQRYLNQRLDYIVGTQVDTICLSIMTRAEGLLYNAKVGDPAGKFLTPLSQTLAETGAMHYTEIFALKWNNLKSLFEAGTDPLKATVDFGRRHGMEVFASIRMNQVQDSWTGDFYSPFKRAHPEYCLGVQGTYEKSDHRRLYWSAFDYEHQGVRDYRVGMIEDICTRYDVDGIELDFWRWPMLFKPSLDNKPVKPRQVEIMTNFFRRIRKRMMEIEVERGKPLLLLMRAFDTEQANLKMGLDVRTYLKEGLIDILVVGGDYNYFSIPAREWATLADEYKVPFYPCSYRSRGDEQDRAFTAYYRSCGADGIYTFNFKTPMDVLSMREIGSDELIARKDKHYQMTRSANSLARNHVTAPGIVPFSISPQVTERALLVGDDVERAVAEDTLEELRLNITFGEPVSPSDGVTFKLNGTALKAPIWGEQQVEFLVDAPPLRRGDNSMAAEFETGAARTALEVTGVDLFVRYKSPYTKPLKVDLGAAHEAAVNRRRRLLLHYDYTGHTMETTPWGTQATDQLDQVMAHYAASYDEPSTEFLDTIIYELGEGPTPWPSRVAPRAQVVFPKWRDAGIDPLEELLELARSKGREVFFSYRLNGSDIEEDKEYGDWKLPRIKERHKDRLIKLPWSNIHNWNFAYRSVRDLKVQILREVASMYDLDGMHIDLARTPIFFPAGQQWENRHHLTAFMRQLREAFQEVARERGRPLLLAVRIPESIIGCTFDGIDIKTWIDERLIDILITGCGASDIDVPTYRRLTEGKSIKVYPSWDAYHPTDGYRQPPVEYWRGFYSKWWELGADGVHTFNVTPRDAMLREIGDREGLRYRDKIFIVERRSGSHGPEVSGDPYDWHTPRHMFFMTYMLAPLPAMADPKGKADTLLKMMVTDDVNENPERLEELTLRLLLSDVAAKSLPDHRKLERSFLWTYTGHPAKNEPPLKGVETRIEVRVNNAPLTGARVDGAWLVFDVKPAQVAHGENLIGIRVASHPEGHLQSIRLEKVELSVDYHDQ